MHPFLSIPARDLFLVLLILVTHTLPIFQAMRVMTWTPFNYPPLSEIMVKKPATLLTGMQMMHGFGQGMGEDQDMNTKFKDKLNKYRRDLLREVTANKPSRGRVAEICDALRKFAPPHKNYHQITSNKEWIQVYPCVEGVVFTWKLMGNISAVQLMRRPMLISQLFGELKWGTVFNYFSHENTFRGTERVGHVMSTIYMTRNRTKRHEMVSCASYTCSLYTFIKSLWEEKEWERLLESTDDPEELEKGQKLLVYKHNIPIKWTRSMANYYHKMGERVSKDNTFAFRDNNIVWANNEICITENPWVALLDPNLHYMREMGMLSEQEMEQLSYSVHFRRPVE